MVVGIPVKALKYCCLSIFFILCLPLVLSLSGCADKAVQEDIKYPELTWPSGAEISRIQFVKQVTRPEDLQITAGFLTKLWRYLSGDSNKVLVSPLNVDVDSKGRLYVVDSFWKSIFVFDSADQEFYIIPDDEYELMSPIDIAIDNNQSRIYVTDSSAGVVRIFDDWGKKAVGALGKDELVRPTGITINTKTSELLVVDTATNTVIRYGLNDHHKIGVIGTRGKGEGQFNYPTYITTDDDGKIFITDSLNFRVQVFSSTGDFLHEFGGPGQMPGFFSRPKGIASDGDGNIYIVDALFDNVQMYTGTGTLLMDFGGPGQDYGKFWLPSGITIDSSNVIYVADTYNKRVQIFQYLRHD